MDVNEVLRANLTEDQYNAVIDANRNVLCLAYARLSSLCVAVIESRVLGS